MRPDKFRKRHQAPQVHTRLRQRIAAEAARRLLASAAEGDDLTFLQDLAEADFYAAKRKAAAVLGHTVRPGDLPTDSEVRVQVIALARAGRSLAQGPEDDLEGVVRRLADHVDRFSIYKMRLDPLELVKQDPASHPEGDALYHSLQVFERARDVLPHDEEFLLAALLHDVGKAIDPRNPVVAGLLALRGTLTERTAWLIEHQGEARDPRTRKALRGSEFFEDLLLLRELDDAGRVPGAPVGTVEEALAYIQGMEDEEMADDR